MAGELSHLCSGQLEDDPIDQLPSLRLGGVENLVVAALARVAQLLHLGRDRGADPVTRGDTLRKYRRELYTNGLYEQKY
jgi:hypothetical protein